MNIYKGLQNQNGALRANLSIVAAKYQLLKCEDVAECCKCFLASAFFQGKSKSTIEQQINQNSVPKFSRSRIYSSSDLWT
jgi:outer membrane protein